MAYFITVANIAIEFADFVFILSGRGPSLYRHELLSLHNRQNHRLSLTVDRIPVRLVPRFVLKLVH